VISPKLIDVACWGLHQSILQLKIRP